MVKQPALQRSLSIPFARGSIFLFQAPDGFDDAAEFKAELLEEVQRLGEQLRTELLLLQSVRSSKVLEPLRQIIAANQDKALKLVQQNAAPSDVEHLTNQVKASFVEQELLLACWLKEGDLGIKVEGDANLTRSSGLDYVWRVLMLAGLFFVLIHVAQTMEDTSTKCFLLIVSVLTLQLSGVVPQFCVGLLVPVFATGLRVLPGKTITETASLCFSSMMNQMTALVIGSFSITAIFLRCQLEARFISAISQSFGKSPRTFLLVLMLGCMFVSGVTFVTLLALSAMLPICLKHECVGGKGLLLGVGISCTLGGGLTPLSGSASMFVLSALTKYGIHVNFLEWMMISFPLLSLVCILVWAILILAYGSPPELEDLQDRPEHIEELTFSHFFFIGCSILFMVGCAMEDTVAPYIGAGGNLGLMLCALSYGSGFLSKADFAAMPWEVLLILFGVNVMAFALKESGLALQLANQLIPVQLYEVWLWMELVKITGFCILIASAMGQTVFATLAMPIVVALGAKLRCAFLVATLTTMAVHCAQLAPHSSTDLILTSETTTTEQKTKQLLTRGDFFGVGLGVGAMGWLSVITVGYLMGAQIIGLPPKPIIIREPTELIPSVIWLGNETSAEQKVEILKNQMEGESVNGTLGTVDEQRIKPMGSIQNQPAASGILNGSTQARRAIGAARASMPQAQHFMGVVRHHRSQRHRRYRRLRRGGWETSALPREEEPT